MFKLFNNRLTARVGHTTYPCKGILDNNFMLQSIRDNAQGIVSKILVSLIAFTFVIWGAESLFDFSTGSDAPAAVNGEEISMQELLQSAELQRRQVLINNPELDPVTLDVQAIQANTLEQLINEKVLLQYAQQSGMAISADAVNQMIVSSKDFQIDGKFDLQLFESLIANIGLTATNYKQTLVKNNLVNQMQQGVSASAFTLPEQANLVAALDGQTRSFEVLVLPFAKQYQATVIDDQAINEHFQNNADQYQSPEQMQVQYLVLDKQDFKSQVSVTEDQVQDIYEQEKSQHQSQEEREAAHILFNVDDAQGEAEALQLAQQAYEKLVSGVDFATVAAEFSQDSGTANDAGSLGAVLAGDFGGAFDETLFALQVGAYSAPVVTQFGVQIIKLEGMVDNSYPSYADQQASLRDSLQVQGAEALFVTASETMADIAFSSPDLQELADEMQLSIQTSDWFDRSGASEFGELAARVASAAFGDEVLVNGNNSEVIELASDQMMVLHMSSHKPAAAQALADVAQGIRVQLAQQQALADLQATAESYKQQLEDGADLSSVATDAGSSWHTYASAPRLSNEIGPLLSQAAFKLARPAAGKSVFGISTDFTGDVTVIRLHNVTDASTDDLAPEQRASLNGALSNMNGQADVIAFEATLNTMAEIERF